MTLDTTRCLGTRAAECQSCARRIELLAIRKLGARNKTQAVAIAIRNNLI